MAAVCSIDNEEKFAAKERANFDMEDNLGDDIGRAGSCCPSRELSNHSFHNFNHAYARELAYVVPI